MQVELFTFEGSNACRSVELLLDHAGIEWRRRRLRPGLHALGLRLRGFPGPTAPAAIIDGVKVQGSRKIARAIADALPQSGLLPEDPADREAVLAAEQSGERLQNAVRRIFYVLGQGDPSLARPIIDANYAAVPRPGRALMARALVRAASVGHQARAERIDGYLDRVAAVLAELDELVERGLLGTDAPTVADFQAAPNIAALALDPQIARALHRRPCWQIAARVEPTYPMQVQLQVPPEWAARLGGE